MSIVWLDRVTHQFTCVSRATGANGAVADDDSDQPSIDGSGRRVAFRSLAGTLDLEQDNESDQDIFVRDLSLDTTERVTVSAANGEVGSGTCANPQISADGAYIAFLSNQVGIAAGVDPQRTDVFVRELSAGFTQNITRDSAGDFASQTVGPLTVNDFALSHDGSTVVLRSGGNFISGQSNPLPLDTQLYLTTASRAQCPAPFFFSISPRYVTVAGGHILASGYGFIGEETACAVGGGSAERALAGVSSSERLVIATPADAPGGNLFCINFGLYSQNMGPLSVTPELMSRAGNTATNGDSSVPRLNFDGTIAVFHSEGSDIPASTNDTVPDVFRFDFAASDTKQASLRTVASTITDAATNADISYDGRLVAFEAVGTNIVGDAFAGRDVFVYDSKFNQLQLASKNDADGTPNGASYSARISGNGRYLVFASEATNLAGPQGVSGLTGTLSQIYMRDLSLGVTRVVSYNAANAASDGDCFSPSVSADGSRVAFVCTGVNLIAGTTAGRQNVYRASIPAGFFTTATAPAIELISEDTNGDEPDSDSFDPEISGNGETVVFTSLATDLVSMPVTPLIRRVFRAGADGVTLLTNNDDESNFATVDYFGDLFAYQTTVAATTSVHTNDIAQGFTTLVATNAERPHLAPLARVIAFVSTLNLDLSRDVNGLYDVYVTGIDEPVFMP
jgi:Tol biopolymer transport system component